MIILICILVGLIATGVYLSIKPVPNEFGIGWLIGTCTGFVACWLMYVIAQ